MKRDALRSGQNACEPSVEEDCSEALKARANGVGFGQEKGHHDHCGESDHIAPLRYSPIVAEAYCLPLTLVSPRFSA